MAIAVGRRPQPEAGQRCFPRVDGAGGDVGGDRQLDVLAAVSIDRHVGDRACCDPRLAGEGIEQLGGARSGGRLEERVVRAGLLESVADLRHPESRPRVCSIRGAVVLADDITRRLPAGRHRDRQGGRDRCHLALRPHAVPARLDQALRR